MPTKSCSLLLLAGLAAFAQFDGDQSRNANIRGGGGDRDGKCTIEIEVEGGAEVEIRGTTARLRTRNGQYATWRRFDCNQPMPVRPNEFRFRGIDGRGRQDLIRDPSRGGMAIVRIQDNKRGREGYTFDVTWRGGSDIDDRINERRRRRN